MSDVLAVQGLTVSHGRRRVVHDVSFSLAAGEIVALVGGSGAGKSTVAKALCGLVRPDAGVIDPDPRAEKGALSLVMQDPYASLPPHRRILDIVAEPLVIHRIGTRAEQQERARAALAQVGLDQERHALRMPAELSGGERQRVAFSRALITEPRVILADEPTGMLDASLRAEVARLMADVARSRGTAILHITHDLALAAHTSDRIIVMADGTVVEQGQTRDVLTDPQHEVTRRLRDAALRGSRRIRSAQPVRAS